MKRSFTLFSPILAIACLCLLQSSIRSRPVPPPSLPVSAISLCSGKSQPAIPDAKFFDPAEYLTPTVMVRKNINSYSAAQFTALKAGVEAMKLLPQNDPTSWTYQAAIHGTTMTTQLPSWNSCEHGTQFFLSWHRMYLYFFERILRAKSGDPSLTLPYWDYQTDPVLNVEYRNSAANNPLYDATRANSINGGGSLPPSISVDINYSLNQIPFFDFQAYLEGPHGDVHIAVGGNFGNMGSVATAAQDPCFWLHHTNIDRLWQVWNNKCKKRANPTDAAWLAQTYTFFDETGTAVNMTGNQILKTAATLNYRYDLPAVMACAIRPDIWKYLRVAKLSWPRPIELKAGTERFAFKDTKFLGDKNNLNQTTFNFTDADANDRVMIELVNPKLNVSPEGVIEVYVNLPKNKKPSLKSSSYAGTLNLFNLKTGDQKRPNAPLRVNITQAVKNLKMKPQDLDKIELTFLVRGNKFNGKEIATRTDFTAESVDIVFERPEKG